ncbi:MAG: DUF3105 domain-containing protein [bacterium]|nr:DUF3105 domain-containing protein [bacterium]
MENLSDTTKETSRYERKRMEREEKDRERNAAQHKKRIKKYATLAVALLVIGAGIFGLVRSAGKNTATLKTSPGELLTDKGRQHVEKTDISDYNSIPPTSGPHFTIQTNWGIHKESVPEGYQIHNLEHGGVILQYKPELAVDVVDKLKAIGESYNWKKLILAPYGPLDKNIALTAWTRLDKFDDFDETRIRAFIDAHRNHGPENVPDNMQSVTLP